MKCNCKHCDGHLEFDADHIGYVVECPHCGQSTELIDSIDSHISAVQPPAELSKATNLIACPDCEKMVSRLTNSCPHCGSPIRGRFSDNRSRGTAIKSMVLGITSLIIVPFCPLIIFIASHFGFKILGWIPGFESLVIVAWNAHYLFGLLFAIPAIFLGHKALNLARRLPQYYTGRTMGVAGLIMGYLSIPLIFVMFTKTQIDSANQKQQRATNERKTCESNLKMIGLSFRIWSTDHDGKFPFNVSNIRGGSQEFCDRENDGYDRNAFMHFQVMSNLLVTPKILVCISDRDRKEADDFQHFYRSNVTYQIKTGVNVNESNPNEILARCPIHSLVLRADGNVERFYESSRAK